MSEWLDILHKSTNDMGYYTHELERLAIAFDITGNDRMYDLLHAISIAIGQTAEQINKATGLAVGEAFDNAQQSSANMLNMALVAGEALIKQRREQNHETDT